MREPIYDLPIVTCPTCATVAVRTRPEIVRAWKWFLRLDWTLSVLVLQIIMLAAMTGATIGYLTFCTFGLPEVWNEIRDEPFVVGIMASSFFAFALLTGAWLRFAFDHWKPFRAWMIWSLIVLIAIQLPLMSAFAGVTTFDWEPNHQDRTIPESLAAMARQWSLPATLAALILLMLAPLGTPFGVVGTMIARFIRRYRWRMRRRRIRQSRTKN